MHCSVCRIDFNTLSAYVKHHRDLHSHSKHFRLICSCGGSFNSLRSLQTHWYRFHGEEKETPDASSQEDDEEAEEEDDGEDDEDEDGQPNDQQGSSSPAPKMQNIDMSSPSASDDGRRRDSENGSIDANDGSETCDEKEQLKSFEKRVLYLLLTLQTMFSTSEAAIDFVVTSLSELFLAISTNELNVHLLAACVDQLKSSYIRKRKATEYFEYIEPVSRSYQITTRNREIKAVKYSYVPFLTSLSNYLQLPEVQSDLNRVWPNYDPDCIQDLHEGDFAQNHPNFKNSNYLKIELNSDELTITNPISHRAHSIFFFYWSLLNVSREKRSKQSAKRLVAACPKWARKHDSLSHTIDDFLLGIRTLSTTGTVTFLLTREALSVAPNLGITITVNGNPVTYFGGLFISLGDYPAQMSLNGFKESVSATHFCHLCDIQHDHLEDDISYDFSPITLSEYRERCTNLELVKDCAKSFDQLSKKYGINSRSLFDESYDVTRQCPYDIMHTLLEGVFPNHLNAFLEFCSTNGYFKLDAFCSEVNKFCYGQNESNSKPHLDLTLEDLRKQNNRGMPLTSMQTYHLFINLPFILKKLLQSSDFPQYRAILICVDILSLCFATTITVKTSEQLSEFIKAHNNLFRQFYLGKMKFKFHFMTHFPRLMKDLGPLAYTSCLATERKHQFFKGNKVRNLKNPCLMLARRHELWACVNDHLQDGSLSPTALSHPPHGQLDNRHTIDDGQTQYVLNNIVHLPFQPRCTLKRFSANGHEYCHGTILNVAGELLPALPTIGRIRWILYDGIRCAFICKMFEVNGYVQDLRAFEVDDSRGRFKAFLYEDICSKKPLQLVQLNGSFYVHLHPFGRSYTVL